jgi:acyl-coenzyme A synthetase/AMP-(fatty) acid ligase
VGPGGVGELLIGGPTVMKGYWGDEEKTSQRLVIDPVGGSQTVYRTGDMVAESPDGNLQFFGRRDNQIKSRGYRIELGEIETVLNGHASVVECAAVAVPDAMITNRIHVYAVVRDDTPISDLVAFCSDRVLPHMVPERIELVERLPRSSTGKIDRQRLKTQTNSEK